jgi:hypothetical protein
MKEISRHNPDFSKKPEQSANPVNEVSANIPLAQVSITRSITSAPQERQDVPPAGEYAEKNEIPSLPEQADSTDGYPERLYTEAIHELRMEASSRTPKEQAELRDTAITVKESFTAEYGAFMLEGTVAKTAGIEDRVIVLESEQFKTFYSDWIGDTDTPAHMVAGTPIPDQGIIALKDPKETFDDFEPDTQAFFVQHFGDEATAQQEVGAILMRNNLTHEVIHQFQNHELPPVFLEAGTYYYQRQVANTLQHEFISNQPTEETIANYIQAIYAYGDDVHKVFFGQEVPEKQKDAIVARVMDGMSLLENPHQS